MSALLPEIVRLIREEGPLPVSRYMALCLGHPRHGYYMTRDPFGAAGDFTTAPEISQIFGELIGLWVVHVWRAMGAPERVRLVELGPGRGTLMADMLRAVRVMPGLTEALSVHLVETSLVLRAAQARTLAGKAQPVWHERVEDALDGPTIIVGNEFLDALPVDQFVLTEQGWRERLVGLRPGGGLVFGLAGALPAHSRHAQPDPSSVSASPNHLLPQGEKGRPPLGSVYEHPQAALDAIAATARHLATAGGAALFIDYGSLVTGLGDTLQGAKAHAFADPLSTPGETDLTVHVDFARMAAHALAAGAACHGPAKQRDFLLGLGLAERAQALSARATPAQAAMIDAAAARLIAPDPTGMGELFKVLALSHCSLPLLPGFDLHRLPKRG